MKILGISFGSKMGNSEIMVKQALMGAEEMGAQVAFLRGFDLKIDMCDNCTACDQAFMRGTAPMKMCVKKNDDMKYLYDWIYNADAMVFGGAVWALGMPGQVRLLTDKLIMDQYMAQVTNEERIARGESEDKLVDKRMFRKRYAGLISQGGARTKDWTAFGLQHLNMLCMSNQTVVVDQIEAWDMTRRIHAALDEELMERCRQMGHNLVEAVNSGEKYAEYKGDNDYRCPVCHLNLMTFEGNNQVICAQCGIKGTVTMENGKVVFNFPKEQIPHSRSRIGGLQDHNNEVRANIGEMFEKMKAQGITRETIEAAKERFRDYAAADVKDLSNWRLEE